MRPYLIETFVYKTIKSLKIKADVYIPKEATVPPNTTEFSRRPVCLYFHGGGMIAGNRKAYLPSWLIDSCISRGWLFVSADYRLAPETRGVELLSDPSDVWRWVIGGGLDTEIATISKEMKVDAKKSFIAGSSAGGYCAYIVSAAVDPKPACVINCYGLYEPLAPHYTKPRRDDKIMGMGVVEVDEVKQYLREGLPEVADIPINDTLFNGRGLLFPALALNGLWTKYVLDINDVDNIPIGAEALVPSLAIRGDFPPTVILHGTADSAVNISESRTAKKELDQWGIECLLIEVRGQEHGFDGAVKADLLDEIWTKYVRFVIEFVEQHMQGSP